MNTQDEVEPASKGVIDQYALLALQVTEMEKILKRLRPAVLALGDGAHSGHVYTVHVSSVSSSSLSIPIVKSMLTPAEIADATVTITSRRITIEH